MAISESTKEKLWLALQTAIVAGLGVVGTSIWKEASKPFADYVVPAIGSTTLLWLSLLLFLLCALLGSWCLYLVFGDKSARTRRRYSHLQDRGFWVHRHTGAKFCGNCLIAGVESPLSRLAFTHNNGAVTQAWTCGVKGCAAEYYYDFELDADGLIEVVGTNEKPHTSDGAGLSL